MTSREKPLLNPKKKLILLIRQCIPVPLVHIVLDTIYHNLLFNLPSAPEIENCPNNIRDTLEMGKTYIAISWTEPSINTRKGTLMMKSHSPGSNFHVGSTEVSYVYHDYEGHISSCRFVVTITSGKSFISLCGTGNGCCCMVVLECCMGGGGV